MKKNVTNESTNNNLKSKMVQTYQQLKYYEKFGSYLINYIKKKFCE